MAIILDADVIIRGEKGTFDFEGWLASHSNEALNIAAVTIAELWHGVERASGKNKARREEYLRSIVSLVPVIPYTEQTGYEHARVWAALESSGRMIGSHDVIVAATALEHGTALATFNRRHFEQVKGLKIIVPS